MTRFVSVAKPVNTDQTTIMTATPTITPTATPSPTATLPFPNLDYRAIIRALRSRHPDIAIVLLTTNPVAGLQRLKRPKLMAYGDIYVQLAAGEGVSLFDGTARWLDEGSGGQALVDGLHPEPGLEARLYARPLAETVARIFGRSCTP